MGDYMKLKLNAYYDNLTGLVVLKSEDGFSAMRGEFFP